MILVFGGTTEGRKAVKELEEAGNTYFYSTKGNEQDVTFRFGEHIEGELDAQAMTKLCEEKGIRLIVDAAHPFAQQLHETIEKVSLQSDIPVIRFERIYHQCADEHICWCDNYAEAVEKIKEKTLFATTGVKSIMKIKPLERKGVTVFYRILPRKSSIDMAHSQGADDAHLMFYRQDEDETAVLSKLRPDAILLKESGESGGFDAKVNAAEQLNIKIYAIRRPHTPSSFVCVNGEHGLRRMIEKMLPEFYPLHSGLTTGTCAAAAALASAIRLIKDETPNVVSVTLPNGETIPVDVEYHDGYASVKKDSGDDPDVTNGIRVCSSVVFGGDDNNIEIKGGEGVGTITLPGFDYPPGEAAINRVPRQMIRQNIESSLHTHKGLIVTVFIPGGCEIALHTFNPRLGITGGISVVGVSGIIKPYSKEGFLDSIRKCMCVAKASGCDRVVINSGAKSERIIKKIYPDLPSQVFIEYGNFIGDTITMADEEGIPNVTLGIMLGKAVKLAAGNLDTHSKNVTMDKTFILQMLTEAGCSHETKKMACEMTLARELWKIIPTTKVEAFASVVINHCMSHCAPLLHGGALTILLIDEEGNVYGKKE
jgi:cobalt-precorrin-5B (C1)-methyltransferase